MDRTALTGLLVAVAVLVAASLAGLWWRRRDGRLRGVRPVAVPAQRSGEGTGEAAALAALGVRAGEVTLLQFSSEFCAPCRVLSRVCGELAGERPGVVHVEVDAGSRLAEVRQLGIWRTPTLLIVDTAGRVAHRASGTPGRSRLRDAVTALFPVPR